MLHGCAAILKLKNFQVCCCFWFTHESPFNALIVYAECYDI
jgi:hypothetical protein